jgi:hypothetical protein
MGDSVKATKAFDEVIEATVKRVSLIEAFNDEKIEAVSVAGEALRGVSQSRFSLNDTWSSPWRSLPRSGNSFCNTRVKWNYRSSRRLSDQEK